MQQHTPCPNQKRATHDFWYATLQQNINYTGKFTTSHITYIAYLVTLC